MSKSAKAFEAMIKTIYFFSQKKTALKTRNDSKKTFLISQKGLFIDHYICSV
jgi:hypothetical protein